VSRFRDLSLWRSGPCLFLLHRERTTTTGVSAMKRTELKRSTPLRRSSTPIRPRSRTNRRQPAETKYVRWVRTLACAVCDFVGASEAAHTDVLGKSGCAQKTSNRSVIPLCPFCHRLNDDSYHNMTPECRWADYHSIDLPELVHRLNRCFELMESGGCAGLEVVVSR
jgi:hypothetical protein